MPRRKAESRRRALALSLVLSVAMLYGGVYGLAAFDWPTAGRRLLVPLLRMLGFILVGLAAGQVIEILGWTRRLAQRAPPAEPEKRRYFTASRPTPCWWSIFRKAASRGGSSS